jgi:phosphate ABC transporter permease protein PstC
MKTGQATRMRIPGGRRGETLSGSEKLIKWVLFMSASMSILAVGLIFLFIFKESLPAVRNQGLNLFTTDWSPNVASPGEGSYGMLAFLWGTIYTTAIGMLIAAPLGIGTAVFIDQIAPRAISGTISRGIELLAGIPSVIIGWFGLTLLVPRLAAWTGTSGYGVLAASLVLMVMALPTITALSVEALRGVPKEYREASVAMGATRWQTTWRTLMPAARRGIMVAVILGMGRAIGETMAVQMVAGNARQMTYSLTERTSTLTSRIITDIGESTGVFRSALFTMGLVLLVIAMLLIIGVKVISREKGAYRK